MELPAREIGLVVERSTLDLEKTNTLDFLGLNTSPSLLQQSPHIEIIFSSADLVGANRQISSEKRMIARKSRYI